MRISEIKLCSYFEIRVKTMYTLSLIQTVGGNLKVMPASNLITSLTSNNLSCKYYKMTGPSTNNPRSKQ